eukprot:evm.model.scf_83.6 EVM.evm.TU.scf_83.6   scf_83:144034-148310(-)
MASLGAGMPYGLPAMLKEGYKFFSGVNEVVVKNIEACKGLSLITRTSLGPNGMNKIVINHLDKLFVTSDASTIVAELDVFHPAAKLVVMAARAQQQEIGDGTNTVIALAGELLSLAEGLLRDGLHVAEVADGYSKASKKVLDILESLVIPGSENVDVRDKEKVSHFLTGSVSSNQNGFETILCPLIAEACVTVCPQNPENFDVEGVRVAKISGGTLSDSVVIKGLVVRRETEGTIKIVKDAKVAVYSHAVDMSPTETKGTVLIKSAEELENYAKSEENQMEQYVKAISEAGTKVVVSGQSIGEMAMHFLEKYGIMAIKIGSKFELKRFCKAVQATIIATFRAPAPEELGFASSISVEEIGGTSCIVLRQPEDAKCSLATIIVRSSTESVLDDVEHAIDNAVNCYRTFCRDSRCLPGAGAAEIELAKILSEYGRKQTGLEQYAIAKFVEALEVVPRSLCESSGLNATDVVAAVHAAHANGDTLAGIDLETGAPKDLTKAGILDLYLTKWWAVKLATDAVVTILKVDQIVMAKQAGGPKPRAGGPMDED